MEITLLNKICIINVFTKELIFCNIPQSNPIAFVNGALVMLAFVTVYKNTAPALTYTRFMSTQVKKMKPFQPVNKAIKGS